MKPPYRVLHVIDHLGTGGAQEVVCQLVKYCERDRFHPEVLTLRGLGHYWEVLQTLGVPVHSLLPYELDIHRHFGVFHAHLVSRLFLFMEQNRFDVVHCHLLWAIMLATPMAALFQVPLRINHEQVYEPERNLLWNNRYLRRLSNRLCHHIIAGSDSIRQFASHVEKVQPQRVSLIYNGVDLALLDPVRAEGEREKWRHIWGIPQDALVVGGIGRLDPQKNFTLFLEVAQKVSAKFPQAMFVIAGDGKQRDLLQKLTLTLGLADKVRFLGFVKELRELYLVMDVLLFPSLFEGTPLTIFGALAMGLPVVASNVDGIAETLTDGKDALLVSPDDKELFVHQVCNLLQNPRLAQELAQIGQETVFRHYSAQAMVKQVEDLYQHLLEPSSSS